MKKKNPFREFLKSFKLFRTFYRKRLVDKIYLKKQKTLIRQWLRVSNEATNFTYNLTDLNRSYLIQFVAFIIGLEAKEIEKYFVELEQDTNLKNHIQQITKEHKDPWADLEPRYGRRLAWYAFVRILKPKIVVETGIDKGLGACILTSALIKNKAEGFEGYYYGTEINPEAGYLLKAPYTQCGEILYGDSISSLKAFTQSIDIFINDSDHSAAYEAKEYETINSKLIEGSLIIGDNAHVTDTLLKFAKENDMQFLSFQEKPANHWYEGSCMGVAF